MKEIFKKRINDKWTRYVFRTTST